MTSTDLQRELKHLKASYLRELDTLEQRVADDRSGITKRDSFSDHAAFNMAATCQNLAVLAGKIEQTANVIRWMGEK